MSDERTIKCPRCGVDVPVEAIGDPTRCVDQGCPLNPNKDQAS